MRVRVGTLRHTHIPEPCTGQTVDDGDGINCSPTEAAPSAVPRQDEPPPPTLHPSGAPKPGPNPSGPPVRVALVDEDQRVHALAQETFFSSAPHWRLESHLQPDRAVEPILQHPPDAALVGLRGSERSALDWVRRLKAALPLLPVLMLVPSSDPDDLLLALAAGATGLLIWPASPPDLVDAVRGVVAGGWYFCRKAQAHVGPLLARIGLGAVADKALPPREQEVLVQLLQGRTDKEIGVRLGISEETVHWHIARLFRDFEVHRREDLLRKVLHGD